MTPSRTCFSLKGAIMSCCNACSRIHVSLLIAILLLAQLGAEVPIPFPQPLSVCTKRRAAFPLRKAAPLPPLVEPRYGGNGINNRGIEVSRHFILRICILIGHYRR